MSSFFFTWMRQAEKLYAKPTQSLFKEAGRLLCFLYNFNVFENVQFVLFKGEICLLLNRSPKRTLNKNQYNFRGWQVINNRRKKIATRSSCPRKVYSALCRHQNSNAVSRDVSWPFWKRLHFTNIGRVACIKFNRTRIRQEHNALASLRDCERPRFQPIKGQGIPTKANLTIHWF